MKRSVLVIFYIIAAAGSAIVQSQTTQTPKTSLADLIQSGNRKLALNRLRAGGADVAAEVNAAQPDGTRPIHWAVYKVDYELVDALIAKKAKVDVTNEFGSTPLGLAVEVADPRMVKTLLDAGAEVNRANQDGQTPLMLAIKPGELALAEMLIKAGANVNAVEKYQDQTALMWAVVAPKNAGAMTKLLLSSGADVKSRARFTDWPSQISSEPRAQYRPVGGLTALLYAARNGCNECIEALIAAGADVNIPTPEGVTPLMVALDNDHNDAANLLLDRGANPNVVDWWGRTALYIVIDRKGSGGGRGGVAPGARGTAGRVSSMEIVNRLLAADVDPDPELNMHRPSRGGNSGRFGEEQKNTGCTPLYRAAEAGDMEVIRALLAKGANPNVNDMGFTPFLIAAGVAPGSGGGGAPNTALLDLMIQHGAEVNTQVTGTRTYSMRISYQTPADKEGISALHGAVQAGRTELVRYLLEKGANPNLSDANGRKPIELLDVPGNTGSRGRGGAPAAGGRGGGGRGGGANPADTIEIRAMLQEAASKK